jgi:glycosyltransferase involved in cell wall biosynthesis
MKILALIPAYNVAPYLADVIIRTREFVSDILVVDDGSSDETYDIAIATESPVVRHETNRGKGAALKTGFAYAIEHDYDAVITLDGDGQHDPKYIPDFIAAYTKTIDVTNPIAKDNISDNICGLIIGSRTKDKADMPFQRRCSNYLTSRILSYILHAPLEDSQSGYRLISVAMLKQLHLRSNRYQLETEIIIKAVKAGFGVSFIPIKVVYGANFPTSIHGWADTFRWLKLVLEEI